jgi:hypothetical protein
MLSEDRGIPAIDSTDAVGTIIRESFEVYPVYLIEDLHQAGTVVNDVLKITLLITRPHFSLMHDAQLGALICGSPSLSLEEMLFALRSPRTPFLANFRADHPLGIGLIRISLLS